MESADPVDPHRVSISRALLGMVIWKAKDRHMKKSPCCEGYLAKLLEENLDPLPAESSSPSSSTAGCEFTQKVTRQHSRALRTEIRGATPGTDGFNIVLQSAITELAEEVKTWPPPGERIFLSYFSSSLLDLVLSAAFQGVKRYNVAKLDSTVYQAFLRILSDALRHFVDAGYGYTYEYTDWSNRACASLHKMENALAFLPPACRKEDAMPELPRFFAEREQLRKELDEAEETYRLVEKEERAAAAALIEALEVHSVAHSRLNGEIWNRCNEVKQKLDNFKHKMYLHGVDDEMLKHAGELVPGASGYHRTGEHFREINTPEGRKRIAEQPLEQEGEAKAAKK